MTIINAIILGLVQGIAEFLPISSSGHLSILNNLFAMTTAEDGHLFYDVLLHLATLISVCVVYWQDIIGMIYEVLGVIHLGPLKNVKRSRYPSARLFVLLVVGTLPLFLAVLFNDLVEELYYNSVFIGMMLILTGAMLYVSDRIIPGKKTGANMSLLDALIIGLCQMVATIPGLSRSGTTITAGIAFADLDRRFAVKFSFLLSIPAVLGANILTFVDAVQEGVDWSCLPAYLVGMAVAMVTGIASISLLKYISSKGKFSGFAYYCWIAGVISIILSLIF